ncbi:MAG: response regulator transcription factor [Candidatus Sulfotelmatobacter sp.]
MRGKKNSTIRIVVASNIRIHAELLAEAVQRDRTIQVVGCASSSREVFEITARSSIDVAVISSHLDEQPDRGFEVLRELRSAHPGLRAIMLLHSAKRQSVVNAFRAGARGIFSKNSPVTGLCKCIRCVHEGQIWASREDLGLALDILTSAPAIRAVDAQGASLLTKREQEVVECVAEGLATDEIAQRLQLSKHTVKNYLTHIFDKLGVSSRVELLFFVLARSPLKGERMGNQPALGLELPECFPEGTNVPRDPMDAYVWCLINEKTILKARTQIAATKKRLAESMTLKQVLDAEGQAAAWRKKEVQFVPREQNGTLEGER